MKTIIQYLEELPEPYRTKAISQCVHPENTTTDHANAVFSAFTWSLSPEGHTYWSNLAHKLETEHPSEIVDDSPIAFAKWVTRNKWTRTEFGEQEVDTGKWYNTYRYEAMDNPLTDEELYAEFLKTL